MLVDEYKKRKEDRTRYYFENVYKKAIEVCVACSGSGYYDDTGSPKCSGCKGTGKQWARS